MASVRQGRLSGGGERADEAELGHLGLKGETLGVPNGQPRRVQNEWLMNAEGSIADAGVDDAPVRPPGRPDPNVDHRSLPPPSPLAFPFRCNYSAGPGCSEGPRKSHFLPRLLQRRLPRELATSEPLQRGPLPKAESPGPLPLACPMRSARARRQLSEKRPLPHRRLWLRRAQSLQQSLQS